LISDRVNCVVCGVAKMHRDRVSLYLPLAGVRTRFDLLKLLLRIVRDLLLLLLQLVLRTLSAIDLEAVHLWHVCSGRRLGKQIRVDHEEDICEGAPEVCTVDVVAFLLGHVDLLATRAEDFDSGGTDLFAHTDGQRMLTLA
jgi:hypothetical protein